ncbi:hypothetical protein C9374_005642 [Naegleria lovaniensis]|uniref:Uncharacterized protein n=1 Tax=Naegleria lovaniensis TaxID=51637 RepID=A0AA88GQW7_NAELO|nr:uncharacterized protein C9374_005642 [Naegleria lovaniensis]KAG2382440.1 hypothetical protein C9374_005642 [Naegleria lovaniensis]
MKIPLVVAPTELIIQPPCDKSDNTIEGLLDESGDYGCSTTYVNKPCIELKFDRVYHFSHLECFENKRYNDGQQRVRGTDVYWRANETDPWTYIYFFKEGYGLLKVDLNVSARYWKFDCFGMKEIAFGKLRMYAFDAPAVNIHTKTGMIIQEETIASSAFGVVPPHVVTLPPSQVVASSTTSTFVEPSQPQHPQPVTVSQGLWEPKYTGPEVNLVPVQSIDSQGDARRENTLEGLLDDTGDHGFVTSPNHNSIILNYDQVYLFTYLEYMTLNTSSNNDYYLRDVNIEYRLRDSDAWTWVKTIGKKNINLCPLTNKVVFDKPIKATQWRLVTKQQCIEIGMLRIFGYTPYVPIQTKTGIVPSLQQVAEQAMLKFPGCDQINLIKPVALYTLDHKKVDDSTIDEILRDGGGDGFVTDHSPLPQCEICFDGIYKFALFTWREFPKIKKHGTSNGRKDSPTLEGVKIEYKLKNNDPWQTSNIKVTKLETNVENVFMVSLEGIEARCFRFTKTTPSGLKTSRIGFGMLRCYAYAPLLKFNIKDIEHSEKIIHIVRQDHSGIPKIVPTSDEEPYYDETSCSDVNVIAPVRITSSALGSQTDNTIEGLIDDTGSKGYSTTHQVHSYIILEFEAVFLFKYLEFLEHPQLSNTDTIRSDLTLYYKVKESDSWSRCTKFDDLLCGHPKLNVMKFSKPGIQARYWKIERICGNIAFGMLQFFGVAPFIPYSTTKGLLLSRDEQEALHLTPYKGSEINVIVPCSISSSNENHNDKLASVDDTKLAENTLEGLLDDSAEYGVCCSGSTLIVNFEKIHFFKYLEYYTHCLYDGESQENHFNNVKVFYKIRPNEPWIPFHKEIETSKRYPYLNHFEIDNSPAGFKARFWKFEASSYFLLLGTLRMYGYASYEPIPTRTGTVLTRDSEEKNKLNARLQLLEKQKSTKHCKTCLDDLDEEIASVMECTTCVIGLCERDAKVHKRKNPTHEVIERVVVMPLDEPSTSLPVVSSSSELSLEKPTSTKDFPGLINYYSKKISKQFPPITTGTGPLKQLNNDPSLMVSYSDEGDSCVKINGPSMHNFKERCASFAVERGANTVNFEVLHVTFTNCSSIPISITALQMEYSDHDNDWKPMNHTQAAYWEAATVAFNYGRELVFEKSDYHGKYVFCNNFMLGAGATSCEYKIVTSFPLIEDGCQSERAKKMIPFSMPYPLTVRLTITDSMMRKKSLKLVYTAPTFLHQTHEQFKTLMGLRDEDFFVECSDNANLEQAFVGIKLNDDGISLFKTGAQTAVQKFTLLELKFRYEKERQNSVLLFKSPGTFCNAEFYLLCDPEFYHKGYAIMVKAASKTNTVERVFPIYEIIKSMNAQRLKK